MQDNFFKVAADIFTTCVMISKFFLLLYYKQVLCHINNYFPYHTFIHNMIMKSTIKLIDIPVSTFAMDQLLYANYYYKVHNFQRWGYLNY